MRLPFFAFIYNRTQRFCLEDSEFMNEGVIDKFLKYVQRGKNLKKLDREVAVGHIGCAGKYTKKNIEARILALRKTFFCVAVVVWFESFSGEGASQRVNGVT